MARLQINADLLLAQLFDGVAMGISVCGANFDAARGVLELDVTGPTVPNVERVTAIVTVNREAQVEKVEFQAA